MKGLSRVLSNESAFGRLCTLLGTLIITNLLFIVSLLPVVTAGAGLCGLYYSMLKLVRYKEINPFSEFWHGFRDNFKKATLAELVLAALLIFLLADLRICSFMGGSAQLCVTIIYGALIALTVIAMYLFPVMATFNGRLRDIVKDSIYFAVNNLPGTLAIAFLNIVPMLLTYLNQPMLPLAAFLWCMGGFSVITLCNSRIMMQRFKRYLEPVEEDQEAADQKKILEEMRKLEG